MSTFGLGLVLSITTLIAIIFAVSGVMSYSGVLLLVILISFSVFMVQQLKWNF
ncbi:hypothetical protein F901_01654 [Acinetobacter dispersus]|nr:hypothetical protein F901_01654 [Acinetobacter dispersus]